MQIKFAFTLYFCSLDWFYPNQGKAQMQGIKNVQTSRARSATLRIQVELVSGSQRNFYIRNNKFGSKYFLFNEKTLYEINSSSKTLVEGKCITKNLVNEKFCPEKIFLVK